MAYVPERGDVVQINFNPGVGKEIMKFRPALVLSPKLFNDKIGMAYVAPITRTVRGMGLEVVVPDSMSTVGVVQTWQVRSFDWVERQAVFVEQAPPVFINTVSQKLGMILGVGHT